jgi:hypothetical protein
MTQEQIDQLILELLTLGTPAAEIDQLLLELLTLGTPALELDQVVLEVLVVRSAARWFLLPIQS